MITSKTYTGVAGQNFIQGAELAFATIYVVKRNGIGYNKYVSGDSNRTYLHQESLGKISFPTTFESISQETVFVLFKTTDVVPACNSVSLPPMNLKNGIQGRLYNSSLLVSGTSPIFFTVISKPDWAFVEFLGDRIIRVTGIPDATGDFTFQFSFENCGGVETDTESMTVYEPTSNLNVATTGFTQRINNITGIPYTIISGSFPVRQGTFPPTMEAVFDDYTGVINVTVSGITFPKTLILYKNAVVQESISVTANGTYTFASAAYLSTDNIQITL